jgi:hypothetical protein
LLTFASQNKNHGSICGEETQRPVLSDQLNGGLKRLAAPRLWLCMISESFGNRQLSGRTWPDPAGRPSAFHQPMRHGFLTAPKAA